MPPRDWGRDFFWLPWFSADPDLGLFIGGGARVVRYGFRTHPYRASHTLKAGVATGPPGLRADYDGELRLEGSPVHLTVTALASQLRILRFFGLGNETPRPERESFFRVRQTVLALSPAIRVPLAPRLSLSVGPLVAHTWTRRPPDKLVGQLRPYGSEPFGQVGAVGELRLDSRDRPAHARRGALVVAGGRVHPAIWDVRDPYGRLHAQAAGHLTAPIPLRPTLSLRAGGELVLGRYPFYDAAFIGGPDNVRGFPMQRFAGDASAWGNAQLRVALGRFFLVLPGEWGLFALVDSGRVWVDGEDSDRWHTGAGGGLWFAYLRRDNTVTIAAARSDEETGFYLTMGFPF
jgi:hypothetical protein